MLRAATIYIRTRGARVRIWTDTGKDDSIFIHGLPVSNTNHRQLFQITLQMWLSIRQKL